MTYNFFMHRPSISYRNFINYHSSRYILWMFFVGFSHSFLLLCLFNKLSDLTALFHIPVQLPHTSRTKLYTIQMQSSSNEINPVSGACYLNYHCYTILFLSLLLSSKVFSQYTWPFWSSRRSSCCFVLNKHRACSQLLYESSGYEK